MTCTQAYRLVFLVSVLWLLPMRSQAEPALVSEAPHWCDFAKANLDQTSGAPFVCLADKQRCIRMNNYGCTKNSSRVPYPGQVIASNGMPVTDVDRHALYSEPKWSLLKSIEVLHRYYTHFGKRSALAIAEIWSPWCDTNGSKQVHNGWGRTCRDGPGPAPASFTGPRCAIPVGGRPLKGQCGPCNCPSEAAEFYLRGSGKTVTDDAGLFDTQGEPLPALGPFLRQVITEELGSRPKLALVQDAISTYSLCAKDPYQPQCAASPRTP